METSTIDLIETYRVVEILAKVSELTIRSIVVDILMEPAVPVDIDFHGPNDPGASE